MQKGSRRVGLCPAQRIEINMTAGGSHRDFGFAARSTTLQGKPFTPPVLRIKSHYANSVVIQ